MFPGRWADVWLAWVLGGLLVLMALALADAPMTARLVVLFAWEAGTVAPFAVALAGELRRRSR